VQITWQTPHLQRLLIVLPLHCPRLLAGKTTLTKKLANYDGEGAETETILLFDTKVPA